MITVPATAMNSAGEQSSGSLTSPAIEFRQWDHRQPLDEFLAVVDSVVLLGSPRSAALQHLAKQCHERLRPASIVCQVGQLHPDWFADCRVVGLILDSAASDRP